MDKINNPWDLIRFLATENPTGFLAAVAAVIAAIIALIGVIITANRNKKNIRMQARIQWIQDVREHAVRLHRDYYDLFEVWNKNERYKKNNGGKDLPNHMDKFDDTYHQILQDTNLLCLYFVVATDKLDTIISDNTSINNLFEKLKNLKGNEEKNMLINLLARKLKDDKNTANADRLIDVISGYLKIEWEKAKKGK